MHLWPTLLLAATLGSAPLESRYPQAVEVYACGFEQSTDRNYDGWPDSWTRRRGPGYPHYLPIKLSAEPSAEGQQCLRLTLDGGAALVQSPPLVVEPTASYVLEASLRTESLARDVATIGITFLDQARQPLETVRLPGVRDATTWRKVRLGPVAARDPEARYAVIELTVTPAEGEDLRGAALFDDLWLARLPRMTVWTNRPQNLFRPGEGIQINCRLSGFEESEGKLVLELWDAEGKRVQRLESPVLRPEATSDSALDTRLATPVSEPGFYRARVALHCDDRQILDRELTLAVTELRRPPPDGEFGWSLSRGAEPLALPELVQLLGQMGIRWVKYPLWISDADPARHRDLAQFVERLSAQQIEIVGLLSRPPEGLQKQLGRKDELTAADIFTAETAVWYPSLEPVLTQLSMKVRWWQLGGDDDTSFVGYPLLNAKVAQIKKGMDRIGQDARLGVGWNWMQQESSTQRPSWQFVNLSTQPPLTAEDLTAYLAHAPQNGPEHWVMIEPLDRAAYDTPTRTADLVQRLLAAKKGGAQRIFATQPFSTRRGLLNDDGTPGELLCPWLTTTGALCGTRPLGSLTLPGGSPNEFFAHPGGEATMFVWNSTPRKETLDLGDQLRHIDLWGRKLPLRGEGSRHVIDVGPLPTLVSGVPEGVVRCALAFQFDRDRFPSVLGQAHASGVRFHNSFPRGVSGRLRLVVPEGWIVEPAEFDFKLAAGEEYRAPLEVRFPYDANNGVQDVRVEVLLSADRRHQFSIHRQMQVGLGDLVLEATTEISSNGELLVHQRLLNQTEDPVSFRCDLYATNRRRLRMQVLELGRGEDVQTYRLPAGRELMGQSLWIRAEEIGGPRALSYRFQVAE